MRAGTTPAGSERSNNVLVNFALNWMFAPGWALGANYYISQNSWRTTLDVTSPIDNLPAGRGAAH